MHSSQIHWQGSFDPIAGDVRYTATIGGHKWELYRDGTPGSEWQLRIDGKPVAERHTLSAAKAFAEDAEDGGSK